MDAFGEYLLGEVGLTEKTVGIYVRHVTAVSDHLDLMTVTARELAAYASTTLPFTHSTRGQFMAALRHYWTWKERSSPPWRAVRVPSQAPMVCRAVEDVEARALVKTSLGWYPEGTAVLFGLYLALRAAEIASAEWGRFTADFDWYTVTGKGAKTATLPVHPVLKSELRGGEGFVFPGQSGGHVVPATVWRWTKDVAKAAGLGDLTTHQLRHTSLTLANDVTGDLRAVQTFARHSKPSTTAGYTRTTQRRLREVSDALDYFG